MARAATAPVDCWLISVNLKVARIDGERAHRAAGLAVELVDLVDGKEQTALGFDRQERRARRLGSEAERFEKQILRYVEVLGLQAEEVDALDLAAGVRANVGERVGGTGGAGLFGSTAAAASGRAEGGGTARRIRSGSETRKCPPRCDSAGKISSNANRRAVDRNGRARGVKIAGDWSASLPAYL